MGGQVVWEKSGGGPHFALKSQYRITKASSRIREISPAAGANDDSERGVGSPLACPPFITKLVRRYTLTSIQQHSCSLNRYCTCICACVYTDTYECSPVTLPYDPTTTVAPHHLILRSHLGERRRKGFPSRARYTRRGRGTATSLTLFGSSTSTSTVCH